MKNPLVDPLEKVTVSGDDVALEVLRDDSWHSVSQSFITKTAKSFADGVGLTRNDRVNVSIPLHTLFGKIAGLYGVMANLSVIIVPSRTFDAKETLKTANEETCNTLLLTPSQLEEVAKEVTASKAIGLQDFTIVDIDQLRQHFTYHTRAPHPVHLVHYYHRARACVMKAVLNLKGVCSGGKRGQRHADSSRS